MPSGHIISEIECMHSATSTPKLNLSRDSKHWQSDLPGWLWCSPKVALFLRHSHELPSRCLFCFRHFTFYTLPGVVFFCHLNGRHKTHLSREWPTLLRTLEPNWYLIRTTNFVGAAQLDTCRCFRLARGFSWTPAFVCEYRGLPQAQAKPFIRILFFKNAKFQITIIKFFSFK